VHIPLISPHHKAAAIQLLNAFNELATNEKYLLEKSLLTLSDGGDANYNVARGEGPYPYRYPELLKRIYKETGSQFTLGLLKKKMAQLKLNQPAEDSNEIAA
jgi:hypothetical protein